MTKAERNYRLLVVDDDETDRRLYGWLLARQAPEAFAIEQAADGAAGIAALRAGQFDCVLLDFSLPDVTGLEFLTEAIADGELPCAVVLITGHGNEAVAVEAMKLGVQDYLVKDHVNEGRLCRAIKRAVSQRELRQRLNHSMRALNESNAALEQEAAARRATEAALHAAKEADLAKSRLTTMMTHELRTPVHRVLGLAQLLRLEGGLTPHQTTRVGEMMQVGRHLFGMLERALDFAEIESGRVELHPATLSVNDLAETCIASIGPAAAERGLSLRLIRAHDAPRRIVADPERLRQILLSLLGQAVKCTAAGGVELRVLASDAPGALRIEVADSGPGISETASDRLFQDFEHSTTCRSEDGVPLGLAIIARFVGLMGGAIGTLANPGGGTIFWLEFPSDETASPHLEPAAPPSPRKRALPADDIAMNRGTFPGAAVVPALLAMGAVPRHAREEHQAFAPPA